jgi:hypothetical protein
LEIIQLQWFKLTGYFRKMGSFTMCGKDGKSIAVLAKAKSNIWDEDRTWKTVFNKIN